MPCTAQPGALRDGQWDEQPIHQGAMPLINGEEAVARTGLAYPQSQGFHSGLGNGSGFSEHPAAASAVAAKLQRSIEKKLSAIFELEAAAAAGRALDAQQRAKMGMRELLEQALQVGR